MPPPIEWVILAWLILAVGALGLAFALLLLLSVLVGGARDLSYHWREHIESARRSRGLCTRCRYDLRYSQIRCPECGEFIADAADAQTFSPSPRFVRI